MRNGGAGDQTTDPLVGGRPAPPCDPLPQLLLWALSIIPDCKIQWLWKKSLPQRDTHSSVKVSFQPEFTNFQWKSGPGVFPATFCVWVYNLAQNFSFSLKMSFYWMAFTCLLVFCYNLFLLSFSFAITFEWRGIRYLLFRYYFKSFAVIDFTWYCTHFLLVFDVLYFSLYFSSLLTSCLKGTI